MEVTELPLEALRPFHLDWLNKPEGPYAGEGMQTSEANLIDLLDKFWTEEF